MQYLHIETALMIFTLRLLKYYLLNTSFKAFAGKNLTFCDAAIWICSPVRGFLPVLAALLATEKLPKPTILTSSPDDNAEAIESKTPSTARPASAFVKHDDSATLVIKSF